MKILTASAMRWAEQAAVDAGETFEGLMETAGRKAAGILMEEVPLPNGPVLILCGKGNNGGDGLVIARALAQKGIPVQVVFLLGRKLSPLAEKNLGRLQGLPAEILDAASIAPEERDALCKNAGLIVDGVFGTGFSGDLPENVRAWTAAANQSKAVRAALDIPSGLNCDTGLFGKDAFAADITVTFAAHKPAHFLKGSRGLCGRVFCADIGIRQEILAAAPGHITLLDGDEAKKGIPRRKEDSNKGDYGKLLTVGGCTHMTGAILMASLAALHCGVGLLKAAVPEPVCPLIAARMPEVIYLPVIPAKSGVLPASCGEALLKETEWADGVLLGCGMSVCEDTVSLTRKLLSCGKSMVIDADGLNCVAQDVNILKSRKAPTILTPHIKEFSRLTGKAIPEIKADRFSLASEFARQYGVTLVLKDSNTVVAAPDGRLWMNANGNSGMAKAGSGDVLAGIIASFLAQGIPPELAAMAGVFLHGEAGDAAAADLTPYCMTASKMVDYFPRVFAKWAAR